LPQEVVLDTSVWVALAKNEMRPEAVAEVQQARDAVVSAMSWAELASLAERGKLDLSKVERLSSLTRTEPIKDGDCLAGGRLHGQLRHRGHPKVGIADCVIYATARRLGVDLITVDTDLHGLPGVHILAKPGKKA